MAASCAISGAGIQAPTRELVVNECLCFLVSKYAKATNNQLKAIFIKFYREEELTTAKDLLFNKIECCAPNLVSRNVKRKGENKVKCTVDDIFDMYTLVDENKLNDKLPDLAAIDLGRIPLIKAEDFDVFHMMNRLDELEAKLRSFNPDQSTISGIARKLDVILEKLPVALPVSTTLTTSLTSSGPHPMLTSPGMQSITTNAGSMEAHNSGSQILVDGGSVNHSSGELVGAQGQGTSKSWADRVATSESIPNPEFCFPRGRKAGPRSNGPAPPTGVGAGQGPSTGHAVLPSTKSKQKIVGTKSILDSITVKSGVKIVKKAVVHVDNVNLDCSTDMLSDYLKSSNIEVISCFSAKSWLRESEHNLVSSFRVCVAAGDREKLYSPDLWPQGVVIRDWTFKSKSS